MSDFNEILNNSAGYFSSISNGFVLGYAQGMKAAKAELKKGGKK